MTQNQYQTLVSCPDCGNTQPFNGTLKPRAHTRCSVCKKDFYVMKNIMPTDYNDNADKQIEITEINTFTDKEGNIYADSMPTVRKKKPYKNRWDPSNLSILRTFFYFITGKNHRGSKEDLIKKLILELGEI